MILVHRTAHTTYNFSKNVQMPRLRALVLPVAADHFVDHINSHEPISNTQTPNSIYVTIKLI